MFKNPDLILKIASSIIAIISIGIGLYEYHSNNDKDFRANFFKQQNQVYEQLLDDLGEISYSIGDTAKRQEFEKSKTAFEKLYFGKLNLYQNEIIELDCDTLYEIIHDFKSNFDYRSADSITATQRNIDIDSIQSKIYFLAQECKASLEETYEIDK